jgi:hypothetical protein
MAHRLITVLVLLGAVAVLGGCGAIGGFAADEPGPGNVVRLEPGELTALPTPGGAAPFGPPAESGTAVTQSFKVTGLGPRDVLTFYAGALSAQRWVVSMPPSRMGDVWREQWTRGDRILRVTAEPDVDDGTGGASGASTSQLDLALSMG